MKERTLILCLLILSFTTFRSNAQENYLDYHSRVIECEQLIVESKFREAINQLETLFSDYDFIFLREIKLATVLSLHEKDYESTFKYIRLGIKSGWTLKSIHKSNFYETLKEESEWEKISNEYDSLRSLYLSGLNLQLKAQVHKMFKKDQKKALGALLRIGEKAQSRYGEKKFAPHSEEQLRLLDSILEKEGYPGEQLIGNNLWTSVILSHHNSISFDYNSKDQLYPNMRPSLLEALKRGEISPYELAQMEDWKAAGLTNHDSTSVGFIGKIQNEAALKNVNRNRSAIGLRSIELRNKLIDLEKLTGMNLYLLKGWQNGKITVADKQ